MKQDYLFFNSFSKKDNLNPDINKNKSFLNAFNIKYFKQQYKLIVK